MHTVDRPSSQRTSFGKMMVHRILTSSIVFMLFGIWSMCEAGLPNSSKLSKVTRAGLMIKSAVEHPDETKEFLSIVAVVLVVLGGISLVLMLIKYLFQGLWKLIKEVFLGPWKLIKFISLGLVVHLPRKLWQEKMLIPALWASVFKIPWLLQVKKFRRPDIWVSNIPLGLFIFNLLLWAVDGVLCVLCLHYDRRFLFLLAPMLTLTYYLYVGVYWARIAVIVLLALSCPVCRIVFQLRGYGLIVMALGNLVLIVLPLLPKSNAWFRKQNREVGTKGVSSEAKILRGTSAATEKPRGTYPIGGAGVVE